LSMTGTPREERGGWKERKKKGKRDPWPSLWISTCVVDLKGKSEREREKAKGGRASVFMGWQEEGGGKRV